MPPIASKTDQETALDRTCRHLVAQKSYAVLGIPDDESIQPYGVQTTDSDNWPIAAVPELQPLCDHFDRILIRQDGYAFGVIAILNRFDNVSKPLTFSIETLQKIGAACLKYTGSVNGTKLPVTIQIYEVVDQNSRNISALTPMRCAPGFKRKVGITAWSLNVSDGTVWTNTRFNGFFAGRKFIEQTIAAVKSGSDPSSNPSIPIGTDIRPLLTYSLVGIMLAFYILQLLLGKFEGLLAPTVQSLIAFGGLFPPSVFEDGEWYRLITAAFLHGGLFHIALNGFALFLGGMLLESWLGRGWFLTIFALSILGGSGASLLLNDPTIVSVGASGAIMGMLAAAFTITFRLPFGPERTTAMMNLMYWLIPALIPLATSTTGSKIDYAAHFGGAIVGIAIGLMLLKTWPKSSPFPPFKKVATILGGISVIGVVIAVSMAFSNRSHIEQLLTLSAQIAPDDVFAALGDLKETDDATYENLRKQYPEDPRSYYYSALFASHMNRLEDAEQFLETGLNQKDILDTFFGNKQLEVGMRALLADILLMRQETKQAESALKPVCPYVTDENTKGLDPAFIKATCGGSNHSVSNRPTSGSEPL